MSNEPMVTRAVKNCELPALIGLSSTPTETKLVHLPPPLLLLLPPSDDIVTGFLVIGRVTLETVRAAVDHLTRRNRGQF